MCEAPVAGVVAERVVDLLEPVEVHVHERDRAPVTLGARDRAVELFVEQPAVGEVGELVVVGLVAQLLEDRTPLADVREGGDRPALVPVLVEARAAS